jgi:hypothetical protein
VAWVSCDAADGERGGGAWFLRAFVAVDPTSFGITPFSILGGALQVQDRVSVRFRILARLLPP